MDNLKIEAALNKAGIRNTVTVKPCITNGQLLEVYVDNLYFGMWNKATSAFVRSISGNAKDWTRSAANRKRREKSNRRNQPGSLFGCYA